MSVPRSRSWASLDDREATTSRSRRPVSTALLNLLPLVLLVGAVSADRFGIRWHGVNLRLELIAAVVLAAGAVVTWRVAKLRVGLIEWCLAGWLAVGAFSSVVFSPARGDSLRLTLLLVGMVALYGVTIVFLRTRANFVRAAVVWIAVGTVVAVIGMVDGILYVLFGSHVGIAFDGTAYGTVVVFAPRVTSTMWEANIFGSYMLIVWALAFALSLSPAARTPGRAWALRIAMAAATTGIVISTTRVVWVVASLLMLSMLAVALQRRLLIWRRQLADFLNPALAGLAVGLALATAMSVVACPAAANTPYVGAPSSPTSGPPAAAASPMLGRGCFMSGSVLVQHGQGFFAASSTSSFTGRLKIAQQALKGWLHRPVLGYGSGSYGYVYGAAAGGWLGNLPLHILFDTGIVGFVLLLVALVAAGRAAFRALGAAVTAWEPAVTAWEPAHYVLFGLVAAGLALLATYEFTDGTWLGFTWVFLGMLVAGGRLTRGIAPRLRSA
jgi:O-Antigen ligase